MQETKSKNSLCVRCYIWTKRRWFVATKSM